MAWLGIEIGELLRPRHAGMGRYVECLVAALGATTEAGAWAPRRRALRWFSRPEHMGLRFFGAMAPRERPEVFHATACVFPAWRSAVEIATVHDLYAVRAELNLPADEVRRRIAYILRADRIICVSRHVRAQLHARLAIPESRTVAIPLAAAPRFVPATCDAKLQVRRRYRLPQEFLLFLGRDRANKNLDRLVEAYAITGLTVPLCIAGRHSERTRERLSRLAHARQCAGSLRWLGYFPEPELPVLLSCASAVCLPSTFEGFGLPVVEAMACGTAVVTSADRATEEAGGGFGILIDPESTESIADGLLRSLWVTAAERFEARRFVTRRTWLHVADETWQVYEQARGLAHPAASPLSACAAPRVEREPA